MLKINEVFNSTWRFWRLEYLIYWNIIPIIVLLLVLSDIVNNLLLLILLCIIILIFSFNSTIKRLHDTDMSAWSIIYLCIPLINIGCMFYLLFFKWNPNKNEYWKPLK